MLLFRSKEHARDWCKQQGMPVGDIVPFGQVWELSQAWYGNRLDANYTGRSFSEANEIFAKVGLNGPFWRFPPDH